jgi:hypothetical protein
MDGQSLDLPDQSFDRVISNFGVIFLPDRVKGFAEIHRVLRPGGRAVVNAWSGSDRNDAFATLMGALRQAAPDLPRPAQPPPLLSLADPAQLAAEMRAGGFEDVRVESITGYFETPTAEEFWTRMEAASPPIIAMLKQIGPENAGKARDNLIGTLRDRFGDGPVKLACEAHYAIGLVSRPTERLDVTASTSSRTGGDSGHSGPVVVTPTACSAMTVWAGQAGRRPRRAAGSRDRTSDRRRKPTRVSRLPPTFASPAATEHRYKRGCI